MGKCLLPGRNPFLYQNWEDGFQRDGCVQSGGTYDDGLGSSRPREGNCWVLTAAVKSSELTNAVEEGHAEPLIFRLLQVGNIIQSGMTLRNEVLPASAPGRALANSYDAYAEELLEVLTRTSGLAVKVVGLAVRIAPIVQAVNAVYGRVATEAQRDQIRVDESYIRDAVNLIDAFVDRSEGTSLHEAAGHLKDLIRDFGGLGAQEILDRLDIEPMDADPPSRPHSA